MASVRWSVGARQDLSSIVARYTAYSPLYAAAFAEELHAAIKQLEDFPMLGRAVPEYQQEWLRELIVRNYRVVYAFVDGAAQIAAIVDGRQDLRSRLGSDPS